MITVKISEVSYNVIGAALRIARAVAVLEVEKNTMLWNKDAMGEWDRCIREFDDAIAEIEKT